MTLHPTRASEIEAWASTHSESRNIFPALVRRLILATNRSIQRLDIPSDEEVDRHGWDGIVAAETANPWVPAGISGWELGTSADPATKARTDLATRTADPLELNQVETTFIFVTPRSWKAKTKWQTTARRNAPWRDVRTYDSSDLAQWLDEAPAVAAWFAVERGTRLGNRPGGSLHRVFVPWCPQTTAGSEDRLRVLDRIITSEPAVVWRVLLSLLPKQHDVAHPGYAPRWRPWARPQLEAVMAHEYHEQVHGMAERLLRLAGEQTERWEELFRQLEHLPHVAFEAVLKWLEAGPPARMDETVRFRIWDAVRAKTADHRFYHKSHWAFPPDILDRLDAALPHFAPTDPATRHSWLFGNRVHLPDDTMGEDWQTQQARLATERERIVAEVFRSGGLPTVLRLAENSLHPALVGVALGKAATTVQDDEILPGMLAADAPASHVPFARGFAGGRMELRGTPWLESLPLARWPVPAVVDLLALRSFGSETWKRARQLGPAVWTNYWQRAAPFVYGLQPAEIEEGARQFLAHSRPFAAMDALASAYSNQSEPSWELVAETLEAAHRLLTASDADERKPDQQDWHHALELFRYLQGCPQVNLTRLATLEWPYLFLLDGFSGWPVGLSRTINADPSFFIELLTMAFHGEGPREPSEPTPRKRDLAAQAHKLVPRLWTGLPGQDEATKKVDPAAFNAWVQQVRDLARGAARLGVCDSILGERLARSPKEDDERWPCRAVCALLETADGDDLRQGFRRGLFNLRGTFSKSLGEDGQQERDLADRYKRHARDWEVEFPRTAEALRAVARSYEAEAGQADEEIGRPPDHWRQLERLRAEVGGSPPEKPPPQPEE